MLILVLALVLTNVASLAALGVLLLRTLEHPRPGRTVARALDASPPPELSSSATRQVISIEILNPIELAGTRGRWAGLAGTLAPGITTRVVHDQALRTVQATLLQEGAVADVRLHVIRPDRAARADRAARTDRAGRPDRRPSGEVGGGPAPGA